MRETRYCRREWLNNELSPSTGSVCAYDGEAKASGQLLVQTTFLEIADCHCKVSLHKSRSDTDLQFLRKMAKLRNFIGDFIDHLQNKHAVYEEDEENGDK